MRRQSLFIGTCYVVALMAVSGWAQPLVRVTFNGGTAGDSSGLVYIDDILLYKDAPVATGE